MALATTSRYSLAHYAPQNSLLPLGGGIPYP